MDYKSAWEDFINRDILSDILPSEIRNSWRRLKERGFDPFSRRDYVVPITELSTKKEDNEELISAFLSSIRRQKELILQSEIKFVLFDRDGVVLSVVGNADIGIPIHCGAYWKEDTVGTTSVSLTLIDGLPHMVIGYQHYHVDFLNMWDASCPVHNENGKLVAVVSAFSKVDGFDVYKLGWLYSLAKSVENGIQFVLTSKKLTVSEKYQRAIIEGISDGLILFDDKGNVLTMNSKAGEILKVSPQEAVGKFVADIVDFIPVVLDVFETKKGYVDKEFIVKSKRGLLHFIKTAVPVKDENDNLIAVVDIFREISRVQDLVTHFIGARAIFTFDDIVGDNKFVREIRRFIKIAAHSDVPVLLSGPRGVGKEIIAQAIHNASHRSDGPFVTVNCGAMPRGLIEQDLFGAAADYNREGRPGKLELANGGTLFLDNIVALPLDIQERLFYTLQKKQILRVGSIDSIPIDIRVIASTDVDLKKEMEKGNFNVDLFYYLSVLSIRIPPLRKRKEDIPLIVDRLFERIETATGRKYRLSSEVKELFLRYNWPGNIRELETVIERAVLLAEGEEITLKEMPSYIISGGYDSTDNGSDTVIPLREMEIALIKKALEATDGNIYRASKLLGIHRSTLYSKMKKYKIV